MSRNYQVGHVPESARATAGVSPRAINPDRVCAQDTRSWTTPAIWVLAAVVGAVLLGH